MHSSRQKNVITFENENYGVKINIVMIFPFPI